MKKVYIVNGSAAYRILFESFSFETTTDIKEASLVCFTGGEDVSPELYGDQAHPHTYSSKYRDRVEQQMFDIALDYEIPMVGICRGGQFLNVMNGGRMYQDVTKHAIYGTHPIVDLESGETIEVSSTHHQMFMPHESAKVVAVANLGGDREWYDGQVFRRDKSNTDYEVLFYESTMSLCFQPHPEFTGEQYEPMKRYFSYLLVKYLGV
ncbi:hypothetical protein WT58_24065 [Burkholderia territorii]|uniref:gamma-glutamyl-gamma-aminobutyrate hydrolase family protein n=1 Tax=Burkholderia territorii TaxID=1503055 RepID=UPI0007573D20|nr:gamma-glutamyl-gamma-aminobutyrate hydrolase family protein [Burkholderia territorii]KWH03713.1 hypothetical protein WT58_24065 [Burkholderia territorii]